MAYLMACKDTSYDWRVRENQRVLTGRIICAVEKLKYVNAEGAESAGNRFYLVREPSMPSASYERHPSVTLFRYDRLIKPKAKENRGAKSNTMSIELHGAENRMCYVEGDHISVYTANNLALVAHGKLDTNFRFGAPDGRRDMWAREMNFILRELERFEKKGF